MAYSDTEDDYSSGSDSEGSLVDFIVNDDDEEVVQVHESDSETSELQEIVADLKDEELELMRESNKTTTRPRRTRKPVKRYIDPDYVRLMEIDRLSQREIDFILKGDEKEEKKSGTEFTKEPEDFKIKNTEKKIVKKKLKIRQSALKRRRKQSASAGSSGSVKRTRGSVDQ